MNITLIGSGGRMGNAIQEAAKELGVSIVHKYGRDLNLNSDLSGSDAVLDFSLPEATDLVCELASKNKLPLVSGVTGLTGVELDKLKSLSSDVPVFWSPNMSIGIASFRKLIREMQALKDWDIHLHDIHHNKKIDRPSGTAKLLAKEVKESLGKDIEITDQRTGGVFGVHSLSLVSDEEELVLTHRAFNRKVFAKGGLQACLWLKSKTPGFYSMDDMLK